MQTADRPETRLATRLGFLVAGFGLAAWAPLVPFARDRVGVDEGELGLLLLCLGVGSVAAMTLTGMLAARHGARRVIVIAALVMSLALPALAIAPTPLLLGAALLVFGAGLGSLDVAINIHAVEVEQAADRPLMSGFHALFSIGGFAGAAAMTALLTLKVAPFAGALLCAAVMIVVILFAWPRLLANRSAGDGAGFVLPRGVVLVIAVLAAVIFLAEGAVLDWSALLITGKGLVPLAQGGVAYVLFAIAMTVGRLTGDALTARIGDAATLIGGGGLALIGFAVALTVPVAPVALSGFLLIGLGAANIVPVLFRLAGAQTVMPTGQAISAVTTIGYAGVLVGPAGIGFVAHGVGLPAAFWILAGLVALVPLCAPLVVRQTR
jgi:MFS family permease